MRYLAVVSSFIAACLLLTGTAESQSSDSVWWSVEVKDGDYVPADAGTYRVYDNPSTLALLFNLSNRGPTTLSVSQSMLERAVTFSMVRENAISIIVEWQPEILVSAEPTTASPASAIEIPPEGGVQWTVHLQRADGSRFNAGRHTIGIAVQLSEARTPEGRPWTGRVILPSTVRHVIFGEPSAAPSERAAAHRQNGRKALRRGRMSDALRDFEAAVAADPGDSSSLIALGNAYLRVGRFRDAIVSLERVWSLPTQKSGPVPRQLALAYVGANDVANATRILRNSGVAADRISEEIGLLRKQAAARRQK